MVTYLLFFKKSYRSNRILDQLRAGHHVAGGVGDTVPHDHGAGQEGYAVREIFEYVSVELTHQATPE